MDQNVKKQVVRLDAHHCTPGRTYSFSPPVSPCHARVYIILPENWGVPWKGTHARTGDSHPRMLSWQQMALLNVRPEEFTDLQQQCGTREAIAWLLVTPPSTVEIFSGKSAQFDHCKPGF